MSTASQQRDENRLRTWPFNRRLMAYQPWPYTVYCVMTIVFLAGRVVPGLIEKAIFDTVTGNRPAAIGVWALVALFVSVELARITTSFGTVWADVTFRYTVGGLLRRNLFACMLRRPGALPLPVSSGEALSRYAGDVDEVSDFPLWLPHVAGHTIGFIIAVTIMARINATLTLAIFLPLVVAVVVTRLAWGAIHRAAAGRRRADDQVTSFLGEIFAAVQSIKAAGAERGAVAHFDALNEQRRRLAVRQRVLRDSLDAVNDSAVTFGLGVTLLLAGSAIGSASFTVGDFALFVYYLWFTTELPTIIGTFIGDYKQQEVSINRLVELTAGEPPQVLLEHRPLESADDLSPPRSVGREPLEVLELRGLSYRHPGTTAGISNINLTVRRGSLTVITGRIGSGKTTLLRALLGLLPQQGGEVLWNGRPVSSPADHFRAPRCAYTPQVPHLFSETLRENILLGLSAEQAGLLRSVALAELEPDIAVLERGLDTLVGPRGVRLSGGQVQRAAAARMLMRTPDLLVCDDLSSALDVETERALWDGLLAERANTCLVVSHRRALLRRADQIVVLKDGAVADIGTLEELLQRCEELHLLWRGDKSVPDEVSQTRVAVEEVDHGQAH